MRLPVLTGLFSSLAGTVPASADRAADRMAHDLFKELIEINTTESAAA